MARRAAHLQTTRAGGVDPASDRPDRRRRRELCDRRAAAGAHRCHPAGGRHARRRDRGGRDPVLDFPTDTIIWATFAIAYQQFENYVVQPRIQSRAVSLDPFVVVVAAIFGGTLLGVIGALLATPTAAAIQIAIREYIDYRRGTGAAAAPT
jgi:AI-2E family transporter